MKQPHWHQHAEEIWKQTAGEVAAAIEETVRATSPRLIVLAGDIRARELLRGELSTSTRALVTEVAVDPRADDASEKALVQHVDLALARVLASRRHDVQDLLRTHEGRGDNESVSGLGSVVSALQQAQAAVVALDAGALGDRTLHALDAPHRGSPPLPNRRPVPRCSGRCPPCAPWSARSSDRRRTRAGQRRVAAERWPPASALLRWPVGPAVPA